MNSSSRPKARTILLLFLINFAVGGVATAYFLERYGYLFERPVEVMPAQSQQLSNQPGYLQNDLPKHGAVRPRVLQSLAMNADDLLELQQRHLLLPLGSLRKEDLRDSFLASRGNHAHEAIDILAPRNTEILAVEDGSIARLWYSVPGGITIYQFDPTRRFEYYYAHLESYAHGLKEGDKVKRGQVIGYVGTSGNAPKNTPHLHFTIFKLTEEKQWWEGTAVNPYLVYTGS